MSPLTNSAAERADVAVPEATGATAPGGSGALPLAPPPTRTEATLIDAAERCWRHAGGAGAPRLARASEAARTPGTQADILILDTAPVDELSLHDTLAAAHRLLAPGGHIVGQIRPGARSSLTRDRIAVRLFEAGYDMPYMWASKGVLAREARGLTAPLARLLSRGALGDGPRVTPRALPLDGAAFAFVARISPLPLPGQRRKKLSVILPVFNERASFRDVMEALLAKQVEGVDIEIVLVESKSIDGTRDLVLAYKDHPRVKLILQETPRGKGNAVREGLASATGDILLIQDADFEYDLGDYEVVLAPVLEGRCSFVLGSRHDKSKRTMRMREFQDQKTASAVLNLGHIFFTRLLNSIYFQRLKDPFTMYKVFRRDCIHNMYFESNRFDFDHEIVGKLVRAGHAPVEVPIRYNSRSFKEGKKVRMVGDPPTWIRADFKYRFARLHTWNGEA